MSIFSNDDVQFPPNDFIFGGTDRIFVRSLIGGGEIFLVNGVLLGVNYISGEPWAVPNAQIIRHNFTTMWLWEIIDGFKVNNLGHPLQGAMYFTAGRVNGFGFYESILFNAFGSFTWESIFESNVASMNDFITTVFASMSMGEMLYRLYLEACTAGIPAPIAFFINPMAGFHRLVTGWEPPNYGRNLYYFQASIGTGFDHTYSSMEDRDDNSFSFQSFFVDLGFDVIYGNPFEQDTLIPFKHFELNCSFSLILVNYIDVRIISDGYIFSFSPVYSEKNRMSSGLSLHFDLFTKGDPDTEAPSSIDLFSNGLEWSIKYQHIFSEATKFELKYHLGVSYMGATRFYNPDLMLKLNYFGAGLNSKLYLRLENAKVGTIENSTFGYSLWNFPNNYTITVDKGVIFWLFNETTYSYPVSDHLSMGVTGSLLFEWGYFNNFSNTLKSNKSLKIFIVWNL